MAEPEFNVEDLTIDMIRADSKFLHKYLLEKVLLEFAFIGGEFVTGRIKWHDEIAIGVINELNEEMYIDKRSLKWFRTVNSQ